MTPRLGQYIFRMISGWWRICQVIDVFTTTQGLPGYAYAEVDGEPEFAREDRELARRRVYELNGWKYRPK
ncbi:hypothetical protein [Lepagella muris]|uniref:Uncharacterized protein n=1 Tax=Lepagella muris TaxID=3032870 RepID=A0AC61RL65_9BACT|nr:hypothetical protein [Lepagella muris]ROT08349.1 hypothetical protein EEL33_04670 [Muribaculaceae bacterium Isolate-037 (Harlan)]TGY79795.1 hypothetical protein E5331_05310 [Lepagella muris]THG51801.1 hypothetical protein E5984_09840 [Bacteroidales bacterium]TKC54413.1 hypothetical protein E5359_018335 [Bacteroidales bacterium]